MCGEKVKTDKYPVNMSFISITQRIQSSKVCMHRMVNHNHLILQLFNPKFCYHSVLRRNGNLSFLFQSHKINDTKSWCVCILLPVLLLFGALKISLRRRTSTNSEEKSQQQLESQYQYLPKNQTRTGCTVVWSI